MERLQQVGRYWVEQEVARGGMGAVYRARTPEGRQVALKLLLAGKGASPLQRRRVATEVQTLLRLRHPHVVEMLDAGELRGEGPLAAKAEDPGVPYLVMEWIEGETLAARLARLGPLDPLEAVDLIRSLAGALEHCHAQGVLHRDLKPANVLLRAADGAPLLTDFGLSKDLASESSDSLVRSVKGNWLGTPGYWPPEQARGDLSAIGPRSDVYGLGALLYAALTGVPPQAGHTLPELLQALDRPPVPPSQRRPGVPAWLDAVCLRALATDASQRPSPGELVHALEAGLRTRAGPTLQARAAVALLALGGLVAAAIALRGGRAPATPPSEAPRPSPVVSAGPLPSIPPPSPVARNTDPEARRLLASGEARLERGDLDGARADFERAIELDAWNARAYLARGVLRDRQGDLRGARADYDQAIDLDPRLALAYEYRSDLREQQGDLAGARADLDRAVELDPRNARLLDRRGDLRDRQGDLAGARADYDRAIELAPQDSVPHLSRGLLRLRGGDLAGARADYDRAVELDPGYARALSYRGFLRVQQGDLTGARSDLDQAVAADPLYYRARYHRGRLRVQEGDLDGARADFDRAIELDPLFAEAYLHRGILLHRQAELSFVANFGKKDLPPMIKERAAWAGARADFDRAIELDPESAEAYLHRGVLREQHAEQAQALADFERAIELDPKCARAWFGRGDLRFKKNLPGARADLDRALELDPGLAEAWFERGLLRAREGDQDGMGADFERFLELAPEHHQAPAVRTALEQLRERQRTGPGR